MWLAEPPTTRAARGRAIPAAHPCSGTAGVDDPADLPKPKMKAIEGISPN
jgi:hypothetical protein